jgi:hypothetical protein
MNPPATAAYGAVAGTKGATASGVVVTGFDVVGVVNGARRMGCDAVAKLDDRATVCKFELVGCSGDTVVAAMVDGACVVPRRSYADGVEVVAVAVVGAAAGVPGETDATCTIEDVSDALGVD